MVSFRQGIATIGLAALVTLLAPQAPSVTPNTQYEGRAYGQSSASVPSEITLDRRVERVPYTEYRRIIEENNLALVLYDIPSRPGRDPSSTLTWTQNAHRLMNWVVNTYGTNINKYGLVDLPNNYLATEIIEKEVGREPKRNDVKYPSFALYRNGKRITRWTGVPSDTSFKKGFPEFIEDLKSVGVLPSLALR